MENKPLLGIRVLEFGGYIASPYAASLLASLGADVVKVERPVVGEDFRRGMNDASPYFVQYNAGKRSLAVDLKAPEGIDLIKALVPGFDVVIENLRPGKMASLGLGRDALTAIKGDLVYASVTGFGEGGPWAQRPAYDMIGQSFGGLVAVLGDDGKPQLTGTCLGDMVTGLSTAAGILAALIGKDISGTGVHMQTSLVEAASTLMVDSTTQFFEDGKKDPSRQSRHPQAQNFCLKTASGESITLHLSSSQKFWRALLDAIERPELAEDPRFINYTDRVAHYSELEPIVIEEFRQRSADEWTKRLIAYDVPFAPVNTVTMLRDSEQLEWLDLYEPERDGLSLMRPPWRFNGERPRRDKAAPRVGEHTIDVASEALSSDVIDRLISVGVLFQGA
ncbi:CaiB/BaiF CoA-transferase family protein [Pseudarthrobacter sp. NPDC080039]|uniref:CaiB/BaiF CoA transferase family protein n=1 Tax=unclassified Pseudarthrobacter TaxID=2647000 RepID=UPI00344B5834